MSSETLKFAKSLVVCLIKSPLYSTSAENSPNLDQELTEFFQTTRTFQLNDYFHIRNKFNSSIYYTFKIIKVEPNDLSKFNVNTIQTSLSQANSIEDKWIWLEKNDTERLILKEYTTEIKKMLEFNEFMNQEETPLLLIHGPNGGAKTRSVQMACQELNFHLCKVNCVNLAGESASAIEKRIDIFIQNSLNYGPCVLLFKSFQYLFKLKDINEFNKRVLNYFFQAIGSIKSKTEHKIMVVCSTNSKQNLNSDILSRFNHDIEVKSLDDEQRRLFLIDQLNPSDSELLENLIKKTSGLNLGEIKTLCDLLNLNYRLSPDEVFNKFQSNRKFQQENRLKIESIKWSDVGGLTDIKEIITDTIILPLKYPRLFTSTDKQIGLTRSGILLYGPPGTGKTLLAKAISNECGLNFLSVKGPELLDMYVGQSEQNVRNLFEKARVNSPCILFFDELDSLAPVRGRAGDSGGVMDRVVSQLLTEIDGLDKLNTSDKISQVFIIGATNRPDLIDQSLLRPGRFDKLVYVPITKSHDERFKIFQALVRKLPIDSKFDQEKYVLEKCPCNLSGADFYAITNKARQNAIKRIILSSECNEINDEIINEEDFMKALDNFSANLSDQELLEYENYFTKFSNK